MPTDSVVVALLTYETSHDPTHTAKTWMEKFKILIDATKEAFKAATSQAANIDPTNEFSAILALPEYFFTGTANLRWPMDEATKSSLEAKILAASGVVPKILIAPGSLYYFKAANAKRRQKAESRLNDRGMADLRRYGKEAFDFNFTDGRVGANDISGLKVPSLVDKMDKVKAGPLNFGLLRNTSYLFLGGHRLAKYDKQSDYHESLLSPDDMVFVPGTDKECPTVGQHRFGVEICFDHALGRLKKRGVNNIDFHIVVSDFVNNKEPHMAMGKYGYFLHASTNPQQTKVYFRERNDTLTDLTNDNTKKFLSVPLHAGTLDFFLLTLPKALRAQELAEKQRKQAYRAVTYRPT